MVMYLDAVCHGDPKTEYQFVPGNNYPLAVKIRWWSKRVSVYRREGYYDYMRPGSFHEFPNWNLFKACWTINEIKEAE